MRKIVLAAACLCCTTLALAQSAAPDAATKDRMDRAKRDASNPMRIIIEASQVKRGKADAPTPAAPAPAPVAARPAAEARPVAERRPARAAEPASAAPTDAAPRAVAQQATPAAAATAAVTPSASPTSAPAAEPAAVATVPPAALDAGPASLTAAGATAVPAAAVPAAAGLAAAAAPTAPVPNPAQPAAEVLLPLKLVRYIEPEIPARIRPRLRSTNEVTVGFKVQPDGSVSNVDIRATTSRALDTLVLDAVRQWRYDPVPAARDHTVQLVFNLTE